MSANPVHVEARALEKRFRQAGAGQEIVAIEHLDVAIRRGEVVAVVGRTGCGKSTFLNLLLGLDRPSSGTLLVNGRRPAEDFQYFKGHLACIFQEDRLLPWRSALDNVCLGLEILGWELPKREEEGMRQLERLGLERFAGAYPHELSGGMRQRVSMARAFATRPEILLADEAFSKLDEVTAASLRQEFLSLVRAENRTAVVVTHQLEEALTMADRVLVFGRPGRLLADLRTVDLDAAEMGSLRQQIQRMLDENQPMANPMRSTIA